MKRRPSLPSIVLCVSVVVGLLPGCGGGSGSPSGPTPSQSGATTPSAATGTRTVIDTFSVGPIQAGQGTYHNIDNVGPGTIDATLDWGASGNDLLFYATDNVCTGIVDLRAGRCNILARSETPGQKPRSLSFTNTKSNQVFSFWIYNNGRSTEPAVNGLVGFTGSSSPVAAPQPSPSPACNPDKDERCAKSMLPPGPVVKFTIKVRSIAATDNHGNLRDAFQAEDGCWVVHQDEFVVFDSTQKNANNDKCAWENTPEWIIEDPDYVTQRVSSEPSSANAFGFLLKMNVTAKGRFTVQGTLDGVESNLLEVCSVKR